MSKKIILLLLPICALILYTQTTIQKENNSPLLLSLTPTPSQPIEITLKFIPDEIYTNPGQNNQIGIQINSQGKHPDLLQFEIGYDPAVLTEISITPKAPLNILLDNNDEKNGRISYAANLPANIKPLPSGENIPVILKFKVKENTLQQQTTLFFLPKTAASSKSINIPIKIAYGAKIFIATPSAQLKNNPGR
jgi:hypothetical protein